MKIALDAIRNCLDGAIPGQIATVAADGTPNVAYLSQVQYVDARHVALSWQFFNSTRRNILDIPFARVAVIDPGTAAQYRLSLQYLRTESEGPLFETMKAKLAGIASHTGMAGVFKLLGADIYRVLRIERVPGATLPAPPPRRNLLAALRASAEQLCRCTDLEGLLGQTLDCLEQRFDIHHAMILMLDAAVGRLYTVASRGYEISGIGSEIALGDGVIGVAARERTPIRIGHFAADYSYGRAIRDSLAREGLVSAAGEIPLPGLPRSSSQLAVPIHAGRLLVGVLYVESPLEQRFGYDDEDALVALAGGLGGAIQLLQQLAADDTGRPGAPEQASGDGADTAGRALTVRHYAENDSIFLDDDYLIKGVAGAILWTLLHDYTQQGRTHFTNRELRLDPRIRLPDLSDNLEARLILLSRRLQEKSAPIRIDKPARGCLRLGVDRPVELVDILAPR
ncbi:GAF domain-containing protein [Thauera humireducens]|uniref:Histidine kinase n=1 Tax=Thauera humireducens TaxID=1134435 RepID=A0A127K3R1_9RHOO|nr:GAF domain-containing protein [Thauera humireducens]AMO36600.1 histidine kinase [Thauera humireducens]